MDEVTGFALAAAGGDRAALNRLVRATQAQVWRFCAHLSDPASADDLTQEVYLRAMKALPRFRGDSTARTWLLAIARRTVADHIRAQQRRRGRGPAGRPATGTADSAGRPLIDSTGSGSFLAPPMAAGELTVAASDEAVVLRAVVAQLPEDRRIAFVLTQLLGLSYAETAQVCRCPIGTVRSRVARARAELVAAITDDGPAAAARG